MSKSSLFFGLVAVLASISILFAGDEDLLPLVALVCISTAGSLLLSDPGRD